MARLYVGNLDPRVTAGELEDEFRTFGVLRSVWVARKPPGFAFIDFDDKRDADDAIRDLDGNVVNMLNFASILCYCHIGDLTGGLVYVIKRGDDLTFTSALHFTFIHVLQAPAGFSTLGLLSYFIYITIKDISPQQELEPGIVYDECSVADIALSAVSYDRKPT
ncbi:hypothetical protein HU200_015298 [Digitaria exilis]|uniref:RRM domain-containing protein n=1 Tax=Digitaria exilis TaxID=1010633 RepID=A0A835FAI2_9POAL|nr:hypothetical protein HU200_015298 [Digitaria exilis]